MLEKRSIKNMQNVKQSNPLIQAPDKTEGKKLLPPRDRQ